MERSHAYVRRALPFSGVWLSGNAVRACFSLSGADGVESQHWDQSPVAAGEALSLLVPSRAQVPDPPERLKLWCLFAFRWHLHSHRLACHYFLKMLQQHPGSLLHRTRVPGVLQPGPVNNSQLRVQCRRAALQRHQGVACRAHQEVNVEQAMTMIQRESYKVLDVRCVINCQRQCALLWLRWATAQCTGFACRMQRDAAGMGCTPTHQPGCRCQAPTLTAPPPTTPPQRHINHAESCNNY